MTILHKQFEYVTAEGDVRPPADDPELDITPSFDADRPIDESPYVTDSDTELPYSPDFADESNEEGVDPSFQEDQDAYRIEALVNGSGMSYADAEEKIRGETRGARAVSKESERKYIPTGRHTVEPSGRDITRMISNETPNTDERSLRAKKIDDMLGQIGAREAHYAAVGTPAQQAEARYHEEMRRIAEERPFDRAGRERGAWHQYQLELRIIAEREQK